MGKPIAKAALTAWILAIGLVAGSALSPTPVTAACESDECEHWTWPFSDQCVDNPGQNTGCTLNGDGECQTYGCVNN